MCTHESRASSKGLTRRFTFLGETLDTQNRAGGNPRKRRHFWTNTATSPLPDNMRPTPTHILFLLLFSSFVSASNLTQCLQFRERPECNRRSRLRRSTNEPCRSGRTHLQGLHGPMRNRSRAHSCFLHGFCPGSLSSTSSPSALETTWMTSSQVGFPPIRHGLY